MIAGVVGENFETCKRSLEFWKEFSECAISPTVR
jgi:hypothetical protein